LHHGDDDHHDATLTATTAMDSQQDTIKSDMLMKYRTHCRYRVTDGGVKAL
jgi:hypothetical protein